MFSLYFGDPSFLVPTDQQKLEEIQRQNSEQIFWQMLLEKKYQVG